MIYLVLSVQCMFTVHLRLFCVCNVNWGQNNINPSSQLSQYSTGHSYLVMVICGIDSLVSKKKCLSQEIC